MLKNICVQFAALVAVENVAAIRITRPPGHTYGPNRTWVPNPKEMDFVDGSWVLRKENPLWAWLPDWTKNGIFWAREPYRTKFHNVPWNLAFLQEEDAEHVNRQWDDSYVQLWHGDLGRFEADVKKWIVPDAVKYGLLHKFKTVAAAVSL